MRLIVLFSIGLTALALTACSQLVGTPSAQVTADDTLTATPAATPTDLPVQPQASQPVTEPSATPSPSPVATATPALLPEEPLPPGAAQFKTDFSKHSVPYSEILSGGPTKDGIPAIDEPHFISVDEADAWLKPQEPVILFQLGSDVRAYPLQILMWHEIANDIVNDVPVTITFCPLCNTAIAFERTLDGQVLDFGTTGRLRFSNLVMYDRQTESWWQQAGGDAIAGEFTGRQLKFLPASVIAWADFKETYPDGQVLSRQTGYTRNYGHNPYAGYDDINRPPFLYRGPETPGALPPMARVLTIDLNGEAVAYPYHVLQEAHVVNDTVGGVLLAVFWDAGTASALDANTVWEGRDVGTVNAFSRDLNGQSLHFSFDDDKITDEETGSEWNVLGYATSGPLAGSQLTPVVGINHFWFSWAAFKPETRIYQSS
ncbi:MAG: DUF3179 domain-containing protein [Anaerolineales bacterium]|nr:MAG: DUF3179 domain-containing protein [Anaerolineales bacterium]